MNISDCSSQTDAALRLRVRALFHSVDDDHSGLITKKELDERLQTDEGKSIQKLLSDAGGLGDFFVLQQLDDSQDGNVSKMEFENALIRATQCGRTCSQTDALRSRVSALFHSVDQDTNGLITKKELNKRLRTDEGKTIQKLLSDVGGLGDFFVLEQLDDSQDGYVSQTEFENALTRCNYMCDTLTQ